MLTISTNVFSTYKCNIYFLLNRFFVKEVYPNERPKIRLNPPSEYELNQVLKTAKPSTNLKKFIFSNVPICLG